MNYNEEKLAEALHLLIERNEQIAQMKEEIRALQAELKYISLELELQYRDCEQ